MRTDAPEWEPGRRDKLETLLSDFVPRFPAKEVAEWAENYRRFWDASFERLDEYLQQLKAKEKNLDHDQERQCHDVHDTFGP